jgi:amino acid adenylation domain-containing protein
MNYNLALPFLETARKFPDNLAVVSGEQRVTYSELRAFAQRLAGQLRTPRDGNLSRVGILASRSLETYAGILAACWVGAAYVPFSIKSPEDRLVRLLERTQLQALIVDREGAALLTDRVLCASPGKIVFASEVKHEFARSLPNGTGSVGDATPLDSGDAPSHVGAEDPAYILFTSGTTGTPKGVVVAAGAVGHFVSMMNARYTITPADRIAAITGITFDLSVFDMFCGWSRGASLWVVPSGQVMAPIRFIQETEATIAFTVPSVGAWMNRMHLLSPGSMPSIRYLLLAGEPLPVSVALAFEKAAPNAVIDNLYGPTEATVVCSGQRFSGIEDATPGRDVVSIGHVLPGSEMAVVDQATQSSGNDPGEILVAGAQLATGYFADPKQTERQFVDWNGKRWYRTGDLGFRDSTGRFHHLGRIDNQVKVRGMRVELEEIETHLRAVYQTDSVAAVAWPVAHGSASGIVAFVAASESASDDARKSRLRSRLPSYMVPSAVHHLGALPLNANGKVDRKALLDRLANPPGGTC